MSLLLRNDSFLHIKDNIKFYFKTEFDTYAICKKKINDLLTFLYKPCFYTPLCKIILKA